MKSRETITAFIENEAGSDLKTHYNERTFEALRTERVGSEYPYPYGFVPNTLAPDGDCADCFVVTGQEFRTGDTVECEPIALLEQTEGGITDHNVIAVLPGSALPDLEEVRSRIGEFLDHFMLGIAERKAIMGRLLPTADAVAYIEKCAAAAQQQRQ